MLRTLSASSDFDEIYIFGQSPYVSKLTFEVKGDDPALFEGHWWKKHDFSDASIYLSSHSGCPVGCQMCGTNRYHVRPASVMEIINQFEYMHRKMFPCKTEEQDYTQLVCKFLYMGEPLLNLANVDAALRYIAAKYPDWIILVSTIGPDIDYTVVKNWIRDFGTRILLSFSVHKLTNSARNLLIPYPKKLTIDGIKEMGQELRAIDGCAKLSFSYNLFNREGSVELAQALLDEFPSDLWIPCIQYLYDKNGKEDPVNESRCNEIVDDFIAKLSSVGYSEIYGFYAPVSSGDDHLITGCGQFVEFQKYAKSKNLVRFR